MVAPLTGIRVIEVANYIAGPSVGGLLSDLGADVIKVEPPGGDVMRGSRSSSGDTGATVNLFFEQENRGKRSITIDLDTPDGPELVHQLLSKADVFLSNLIAPRLERFNLGPEAVHRRNASVIYVSVTGYGLRGPDAGRAAFDYAAFWARSGMMSLIGHPGDAPVLSRVGQGDHTTGVTALAGVLAALRLRDQTGEGQVVEVSLQRAGVYTIATDVTKALADGKQPSRMDRTRPTNPLFNTYQAADGRWLMVVHMTPDPYWARFCNAIGLPQWGEDARFTSMSKRAGHTALLATGIQERIGSAEFGHWARVFDEHGLIWAPAADLPEVISDPQLRAVGAFETTSHPSGDFETVAVPFAIWNADVGARGLAPQPGEHTLQVLREIGLDDEQIAALAAGGVLG
jgi:crotonobetainyl-CoA:carnitine CoA-transferase CaiB-like acyl-CoA transferase